MKKQVWRYTGHMKYAGIDFGLKRIGVALSDEEGRMAFPKATVPNDKMLMPFLREFLAKENVETVIVGESHAKSGEDNPIQANIRHFVQELGRETGLSVEYEPEFYTSAEARRLTGKQTVDAEAATIILESYLNRRKQESGDRSQHEDES
jgi:putative Holliday junction resolvase